MGKPLYANSITKEQGRPGFARILVEVHSDSKFSREIVLKGARGKLIHVGIEYPWIWLIAKTVRLFSMPLIHVLVIK